MYERYLEDHDSVPAHWQQLFAGINPGRDDEPNHDQLRTDVVAATARRFRSRPAGPKSGTGSSREKQAAVSRLIQVYSLRGHQVAELDPLKLWKRHVPAVLKLDYLGLSESDMDSEFYTGGLAGTGSAKLPLREILAILRKVYCGRVGSDFAHVSRARERIWLRQRLEHGLLHEVPSTEERRILLEQLTAAEGIERYLHTRYVGQKRFSLEGGDSLIPMLDGLIQFGGAGGIQDIVIGMAHRGRINVLVNVLGKAPQDLFSEFEGDYDPQQQTGSGDVKYHLGYSSDVRTPGGNVHVTLAFNPSHLEIVDPVVEGSVKARQDRREDAHGEEVLPVLVHGDAAFAAQGVVTETFQLSKVRGFDTGGTVHIVVNNQIGFTTSDVRDARSTPYCSDVAKMIEAPVFHVNGDDPEAALFVTRLALAYRQAFRKDVVIDLVCYRRHGHNEADEPAATQPLMYKAIKSHPTVRQAYAASLVGAGVIAATDVDDMMQVYRERLDQGEPLPQAVIGMIGNEFTADWTQFDGQWDDPADTHVSQALLDKLVARVTHVPTGFALNPRLSRIMADRSRMAVGEIPIDWGFAEHIAYGALLDDGYRVRLTGQDSRRGTFFHRHATLIDQNTGRTYESLDDIAPRRDAFTITDSLLSEEAVLGFEYGYSTTDPDCLVIWEAQFGDFANGAQVVIDQFISSGEAKWGRLSAITLFLPHGYEGQGPEHSSARLERFLQLCAEHNMQVCVPSTPAQMFHMLRRQMLRDVRKPLVVLTPKSLLRHRLSSSPLSDLTDGKFHTIIGEQDALSVDDVKRIVFCSGKVYFDLLEARRVAGKKDVALIRIEQLYPFDIDAYAAAVAQWPGAREIVWCQEEPQNQGAWYQIRHRLQAPLNENQPLFYAGRPFAAAPASGIFDMHVQQQQALVEAALGTYSEDNGVKNK
jgi:2-oxoglutarate dehydrogenase E1 component